MSQAAEIIDYIRKRGSITTKQAQDDLGCYRLSARMGEIKKVIPVEREMITVPTRNGGTTRVARYTIPGGVPECFTP